MNVLFFKSLTTFSCLHVQLCVMKHHTWFTFSLGILCLFYSNSSLFKFASQLISSKLLKPTNCSWIRRTHSMLSLTLISCCVCCISFSLGENVLTVLYFQRRTIYTNMGTVKWKFHSELWKVDIFLNSFHCLYPNLRVTDMCYSFGKTPCCCTMMCPFPNLVADHQVLLRF